MNFYYCPGSGKIRPYRVTLADRLRMRQAMKKKRKEWRLFI